MGDRMWVYFRGM